MTTIQKLDAAGNQLPADTTAHAILVINGLRIDVRPRTKKAWAKAIGSCDEGDLLALPWRAATLPEVLSVADFNNPNGPFDKTLFPNLPEYGWLWTSTPYAREEDPAAPVCAWGVDLCDGYADIGGRYDEGLALPVSPLAAPASQS